MHNLVYLIGRLPEDPELKDCGEDKKMVTFNLAVQRSFKNEDGIYETDFIRCVLWNLIAVNASEYCRKGDLVGIKGRIQTRNYEDEETKEKKYITEVIVEKISFLASKREEDKEEEGV